MKKIILIFILAIFSTLSYSLNFSIAPTKFEVDLNKRETQEAFIINNTSSPLRIEVYLDTLEGYEEKNLNSNIVIFPKKVSVRPGGKQTVRFRVKDIENLKDGEYKSLLVFKEIPKDIKTTGTNKSDEIITEFSFITELAVRIIGVKGEK